MIDRLLQHIKDQQITPTKWTAGFVGIFFIRFILESFSSPTNTGIIASDPYTLVHYGLFFLTVIFGIMCILGYFSKDYSNASKLVLFSLPIIWLGPILDMIISFGKGYKMTYLFESHSVLLLDFFKFFSPEFMPGATYGIRIEIIIILVGLGFYVWKKSKDIIKSLLTIFTTYVFIFILATIPGIIYTISNVNSVPGTQIEIVEYLEKTMIQSNIFHNTLHDGTLSTSRSRFIELGFNKLMSQILFIINIVLLVLWFFKSHPQKFKTVLRNLRPERTLFYILLLILGMSYAYLGGERLNSWVDIFGITCLIISWISVWMYAVYMNDIADVEIDKISNPNRPLVQKKLSSDEMHQIGFVWFVMTLVGSWSAGFYPFVMALIFISASHIYSVPPLRLRRVPLLASFLISIACLATIMSGFFFVSSNKSMLSFPTATAIGIVVIFTLAVNIRDLKDVEGDKKEGIKTLPVIFGQTNGPRVVGALFALSLILIPLFLSFYLLYIISIPTSIIGYKIINRKPYKEKRFFALILVFITLVILLFALSPMIVSDIF